MDWGMSGIFNSYFTPAVPSLYIAPPPSRPDTPQIPVARSLGLYRRISNRRIFADVYNNQPGAVFSPYSLHFRFR